MIYFELENSTEQVHPDVSSASSDSESPGHRNPLENTSSRPTVSPSIAACDDRGFGPGVDHVFELPPACLAAEYPPNAARPVTLDSESRSAVSATA